MFGQKGEKSDMPRAASGRQLTKAFEAWEKVARVPVLGRLAA
jgi:hypothetical protein